MRPGRFDPAYLYETFDASGSHLYKSASMRGVRNENINPVVSLPGRMRNRPILEAMRGKACHERSRMGLP